MWLVQVYIKHAETFKYRLRHQFWINVTANFTTVAKHDYSQSSSQRNIEFLVATRRFKLRMVETSKSRNKGDPRLNDISVSLRWYNAIVIVGSGKLILIMSNSLNLNLSNSQTIGVIRFQLRIAVVSLHRSIRIHTIPHILVEAEFIEVNCDS